MGWPKRAWVRHYRVQSHDGKWWVYGEPLTRYTDEWVLIRDEPFDSKAAAQAYIGEVTRRQQDMQS